MRWIYTLRNTVIEFTGFEKVLNDKVLPELSVYL
jgi:hypothetical protein